MTHPKWLQAIKEREKATCPQCAGWCPLDCMADDVKLLVSKLETAITAIDRVIKDDETGHWGPDITMKGVLENALRTILEGPK